MRLASPGRHLHTRHFRTTKDRALGRALQTPILSAADYLAWEATQAERHEFIVGHYRSLPSLEE